MRKSDFGARAKRTKFHTVAIEKPKSKNEAASTTTPPPSSDLPSPEPIKVWKADTDSKKSSEDKDKKTESSTPPVNPSPTTEVKLDLGCGQNLKPGFEGVDLYSKEAKHKFDLFRFPWPLKDSSVDELYSSHFIEHIPMVFVCKKHGFENLPCEGAQDLFFAFFDEAYRVLKPGGKFELVCPSCRSERAFWDPTHRRFLAQTTFFYLSDIWRKANKLDHYNVKCNFAGDVNFSFSSDIQSRHEEVQRQLFQQAWNIIMDYMVVLKSQKPA